MKKLLIVIGTLFISLLPSTKTVSVIPLRQKEAIKGVENVQNVWMYMERQNEYFSLGNFTITAYCPCNLCCGKEDSITYSGTIATEGRTIAVDPKIISIGSTVKIQGLGEYVAEDIGGAINSNHIDLFLSDHSRCLDFGVQTYEVYLKKE